jgi:hypothetical protein
MTLPESDVNRARQLTNWAVKFSGAQVVGGGGVALAMLVSGSPVHQQSFIALDILYGLLLSSTAVFVWQVTRIVKVVAKTRGRWLAKLSLVASVVFGAGTAFVFVTTTWPAKAFTLSWWFCLGLALAVAILAADFQWLSGTVRTDLKPLIAEQAAERATGVGVGSIAASEANAADAGANAGLAPVAGVEPAR